MLRTLQGFENKNINIKIVRQIKTKNNLLVFNQEIKNMLRPFTPHN